MYLEIHIIKFTSLIAVLVIAGCTAEGNSQFLTNGETTYFLTMEACEKEAHSEYDGGGRKYSGYECRKMLLGLFQLESKTFWLSKYYDGELRVNMLKNFVIIVPTGLLFWFGTAIVRLKNYHYANQIGYCAELSGTLQLVEKDQCLHKKETRANQVWHLLYGLDILWSNQKSWLASCLLQQSLWVIIVFLRDPHSQLIWKYATQLMAIVLQFLITKIGAVVSPPQRWAIGVVIPSPIQTISRARKLTAIVRLVDVIGVERRAVHVLLLTHLTNNTRMTLATQASVVLFICQGVFSSISSTHIPSHRLSDKH